MDDGLPTRRRLLRLGGIAVATGLAGCSGGGGDGGGTDGGEGSGDGDGDGSPTTDGDGSPTTTAGTTTAPPSDPLTQAAKLLADDGGKGDRFGADVAVHGDTAFVTSTWEKHEKDPAQGSAYVFERSDGDWSGTAHLTGLDGEQELDGFGQSVTLVADTALVGAFTYDPKGPNSGAAYVYDRSGGDWTRTKLTPDDGDKRDWFGVSVALADGGDLALVGAARDEDPNGKYAGSAYVFERSGGSWSQATKLTPDDGDDEDGFGGSVALAGTTAVVGAGGDEDPGGKSAGAAYVFERSGGSWSQATKLTPDDGDSKDRFGFPVDLSDSGDTALLGARTDEDPNGETGGAAYVFERSGGSWSQAAKLAADDGDSGDAFGVSAALAGGTAILGASGDELSNGRSTGSAYVFERSGGSWSQATKLSADDGERGDFFGHAVDLTSTTAVVGANFDDNDNGENAGSAYVFER